MNNFVIPALGSLTALMGLVFLLGCFTRVDSPSFIARAGDDIAKIRRLQTLQDGWDKLGKLRQAVASSLACLVMGSSLLVVWRNPLLAHYYWVVLLLFAVAFASLLLVRNHAQRVLDPILPGHAEILTVVKRNLRMCVSFSVVFVVLAARA